MKKIKKKERHVRWNWEKSPEDLNLVRFHFVIVDNKYRRGKMVKILEHIQSGIISNYPFAPIRSVEGKVEGTQFRYLFESYDTSYSPKLLNMDILFKENVQDTDLCERTKKNTSIENYVADLYA